MNDLDKEIIQRRRELAEKTIRRISCCIENRCFECDLNKRFDGGACYDNVMADAKSLLHVAYVIQAKI